MTVPPLRIGPVVIDPPVLLAPMAGYTNYAFRQLVRELGGVGMVCTEMVSARGLVAMASRKGRLPDRLWGIEAEPRPLAVQIWDNDPEVLAAVAERLARELRPSVIDLNFGCPAPDVAGKAQSGAYLLRWPQRVETLVRRVVAAAAPLPVTAKLRLGWDAQTINAAEVAQAVEAAGGAAVTIHGRTAAELYRGKADWERIAAVKPYLRHIPLIGNGDLKTPQDVVRAFERYSVDGVMIGRAALGQPWLFREVRAALRDQPISSPPDDVQQCEIILRHYSLLAQQFGPRKATVLMRKHACRYVSGRAGARAFRERLGRVSSPRQLVELLGGPWP